MTDNQISSGLRLIVDLNLDKINDMLLIRPKFDKFPPNYFLPQATIWRLSNSVKIYFEYVKILRPVSRSYA